MMAPSVSEAKILYVCGKTGSGDGAQIFDRKLLKALIERGIAVSALHPLRLRALRLPLWRGRLQELNEINAQVRHSKQHGTRIVLSHEVFFGIAHKTPVDLLIVHNYMPCFSFPGRRLLELYYRVGSRKFLGQAFANARAIAFLSQRDQRHAVADFPQIANRSHVLPPPPHPYEFGTGGYDVIHISGSDAWLPKRLSRLTQDDLYKIRSAGFGISDFKQQAAPAFGLIPDRFTVGFKLKLMQMLYCGDAIASLSDICEEITALAPDYPWWREVASVDEAVEWFSELRGNSAWRAHCIDNVRLKLPNWAEIACKVNEILDR